MSNYTDLLEISIETLGIGVLGNDMVHALNASSVDHPAKRDFINYATVICGDMGFRDYMLKYDLCADMREQYLSLCANHRDVAIKHDFVDGEMSPQQRKALDSVIKWENENRAAYIALGKELGVHWLGMDNE